MSIVEKRKIERFKKAAKLKQYRTLMGMKAKEIAVILNVEQSTYSRMENGYCRIDNTILEQVEHIYKAWRKDEAERVLAYLEKLYSV